MVYVQFLKGQDMRLIDLHNLPEQLSTTELFDLLEDMKSDKEITLEEGEDVDDETNQDIIELSRVCEELSTIQDARYGAEMIREDYFVDYITDLINDCYDLPKELNNGDWPWRHVKIDYEAAAEEAKQDYNKVEIFGEIFYVRA